MHPPRPSRPSLSTHPDFSDRNSMDAEQLPRSDLSSQTQNVWSFGWGLWRERKGAHSVCWVLVAGGWLNGAVSSAVLPGCGWNPAWVSLGQVCACCQHRIVPATRRAFHEGSLRNQTCPGSPSSVPIPHRLVEDACVVLST